MTDPLPSPSHLSAHPEEFSAEDIHDLLGGVLGDDVSAGDLSHAHSQQARHLPVSMEDDAKVAARTERKRSREKQRRSDVNRQFGELTALLKRIETEDPSLTRDLPAYSPANRVDLIARTVGLIHSLYDTAKKRKVEIDDLQEQLEAAKKAGEETAAKLKESMMAPQTMGGNKVMMMVPMMIGADNTPVMMAPWMQAPAAAAASAAETAAPTLPPPMMMPWGMMPSMAMAPTPTSTAPAAGAGQKEPPASSEVSSNLAHCA